MMAIEIILANSNIILFPSDEFIAFLACASKHNKLQYLCTSCVISILIKIELNNNHNILQPLDLNPTYCSSETVGIDLMRFNCVLKVHQQIRSMTFIPVTHLHVTLAFSIFACVFTR